MVTIRKKKFFSNLIQGVLEILILSFAYVIFLDCWKQQQLVK